MIQIEQMRARLWGWGALLPRDLQTLSLFVFAFVVIAWFCGHCVFANHFLYQLQQVRAQSLCATCDLRSCLTHARFQNLSFANG